MKRPLEKTLYPLVDRWMRRHFGCFRTAVNKGLRLGRIDIIGVRDIGGDLSGEVETIAIEVKRGACPFANGCGQALGYNTYANRVYLADWREESFSRDELHIASHLGIGLIQIRGKRGDRCNEVVSSPFYRPITKLNLGLLESLCLGRCQLCGCFFEIGDAKTDNRFSRVAREKVAKAVSNDKGLIFWNREVADRKNKVGIRSVKDGSTYERRYICPDCIYHVIGQLLPDKNA